MDYICVVYSFIILIYKCNAAKTRATEHRHEIFISSLSETEKLVNYTVKINKPLEVRFLNIPISSGSCVDFYERVPNLEARISNSTFYVTNITYSMSTRWKCKLIKSNVTGQQRYYYLYLDLHVRGAKSVEVTVNDKVLSFSEGNTSDPYDGDADYLYERGERVHIVCRNPHRTGTVRLKNSTDWSSKSNNAPLYMQLSSSDHSYVDCVYSATEPYDRYVYRVHFVPKKLAYTRTDESTTSSNDIDVNENVSLLPVACSIGAVLVGLTMAGVACYCVRTRTRAKNKVIYGDLENKIEKSNSQTNICDNQYDECHYDNRLSKRETYYEVPGNVQNVVVDEPNYTEIDYSRCKPKTVEAPIRISQYVYDEPYL